MNKDPMIVPHSGFFIENLKRKTEYNMYNYHLHQEFEIYYLLSGERKYFINNTIYKIQQGNLILIDANEIHKTGNIGQQSHERTVLNFSPSFLKEFYPYISQLRLLDCFNSKYRVLPLSFQYKKNVEVILNKMLDLTQKQSDFNDTRKKFYLQILLCELLVLIDNFIDELKEKEYEYTQLIHPKISEIIKYINEHYQEFITLEDMANRFKMSTSYLSKLFYKTTNFTFTQYLNSVRIKNSKYLLENPEYRIIDVAQKSGFNSNTHFTRVFKNVTGVSPTEYRKLLKEGSKVIK